MVTYDKYILDNGLTLICNTDRSTPFVSVNTLYKVGARDEDPHRTGFAHLFEHLMFGGSVNIPDFDAHVQRAGGENNAFTTNDYTNYYINVPAANIETALWLESDRMLSLDFSQRSLDVQKQVVIEEYKQRYLNRPYGDIWLKLRPLAYKVHPYQWPTIGKNIEQIQEATLDDVKAFFRNFYAPDNAILTISGNIEGKHALELVKKWFGDIPPSGIIKNPLPQEPPQTEARKLIADNNKVPADMIYKVYHMGSRNSDEFYAADIISDILSNGQSSRLYLHLIKESSIFSEIDAYVSADMDPGLFIFSGKLSADASIDEAEEAILHEIQRFLSEEILERELQKVINKTDARISYSEISYQAKATNLAFFEYLGDVEMINSERERYAPFSGEKLKRYAAELWTPENCSTLWYLKEK